MKKPLLLSALLIFACSSDDRLSDDGKYKISQSQFSTATSCICDFGDFFAPNKKIDIANFTNSDRLLASSNNKKLFIHNRKDILLSENILIGSGRKNIALLKVASGVIFAELNKVTREVKEIYKKHTQKQLKSNISSYNILRILNPDLYSTGKNKVIELRNKYSELLVKYNEMDILFDCLILKRYDKTKVLENEFESSFAFWENRDTEWMDRYYMTRLNFSEAKNFDRLGFYFLRRIFSILGYLPYLLILIFSYKFLKNRKKSKP